MSDSKHIINLLNLMSNNLKESMENSITVVVIHFLYEKQTKIVSDILNKKTIWKEYSKKHLWIEFANECIQKIEFDQLHSE
jgi:hypothetical protein